MSIAIVTDSTADLPEDIIHSHGIEVIPALLTIEDQTYLDGIGLSREEFYLRLPFYQKPPTTSAPSISHFQEVYEKLLEQGVTQVISIHVASAFSSVYNIACIAAETFQGKVQVIDSMQVTLGMGFQVLAAAEAAARDSTLEDIQNLVRSINQRIKFYALLDTLEYVKRSGRVSWASAAVTSFLNLKVMIEVKLGQVHRLAMYRSRRLGMEALINRLTELGPLDRLAVMYTSLTDQSELNEILETAKHQISRPPIIGPVTTVIGTHVGSNGVGFIALSA